MITGKKGVLIIEQFEGFEPKMYKDAVGLPTIGYGTLIDTKAEQWLKTATITKDQAEVLLRRELGMIERNLNLMLKKTIHQNQFDALVSFAYNLGIASLRTSTLLKKVNKNPADDTIRNEFMKWVHAGGKVLKGLQTRRKAEADLYFTK
jgi:lysozyme